MLADFVVLSAENKPIVAVEARARKNTSASWAQKYAEEFLAQNAVTEDLFFVLATLEQTYLWPSLHAKGVVPEPSCTINTRRLLGQWMPEEEQPISALSFETLISGWISSITAEQHSNSATLPYEVVSTGLVDAIRNGKICSEARM
jgi:hypothetical protein